MFAFIIATSLAAGAVPQQQPAAEPAPRPAPMATPDHARHGGKRTGKTTPPASSASGTVPAQPADPSGTVPQGAPGTQDPTIPGSPPSS